MGWPSRYPPPNREIAVSEIELLACPFCGGRPEIVGETSTKIRCAIDQCISRHDIGGFNFYDHRNAAIIAWNTRASLGSQPGDEVEKVGGDVTDVIAELYFDLASLPINISRKWESVIKAGFVAPQPAGEGADRG